MRVAVIGAGKMGRMIARQMIKTEFCQAGDICLSKGRPDGIAELQEEFPDSQVFTSNREAVQEADLVFLCVRPQNFQDVSLGLDGAFSEKQLVISVVTGTSLDHLQRDLGVKSLVRCSTNIGIESGSATSCWMGHDELSDQHYDLAKEVFTLWGDQIRVTEEDHLEIAIVGLGSGPAYVLEAEENWIRAMRAVGMPPDLADRIGRSMFARTTAIANLDSDVSLSELQNRVLTSGGITFKVMEVLDKGAFRFMVVAAFKAAHKKVKRFLKEKED